jgi:hypothetical protein
LVAVGDERHALSDCKRLDWLRLGRAENGGPITFLALIERYGEASQALAALLGLARVGGRRKLMPISPLADIESEVFSIPGSLLDPRRGGANHLLRQGAVLTESTADIIDVLREMSARSVEEQRPSGPSAPTTPPADDGVACGCALVAEKLSPAPVEVDELVRQCHLSPAVVLTILLELELAGRIERHPGNQVSSI